MFQRTTQDLVKGIRNHKRDPVSYISKEIASIRKELKSNNLATKYVAIQKLTYLHMVGYNVNWASFHIVEVMASPRYAHKRTAMLAATQTFTSGTEVILLTTNLLKKEIQSKDVYQIGTALSCVSNIATKELARDLLDDVTPLLNSTKPYIRKKAILTLYKLFLRYPQGLKLSYERLRQRLDDSDMSVVSCTVNVICELSRKNPKNFLPLAPQLFHIMTTSSNNWMLIKIVKLFAALQVEEARLARKLLEPLVKIVETTAAKSLPYECINTVTIALKYTRREDGTQPGIVPTVVKVCTNKLKEFVQDEDQNLKYLGLVGFIELMHSHPSVVAEHKDLVLKCLLDDDITVKLRALELLTGMVTKQNLIDIVQKFLEHVQTAEGKYRDELINKIIFVCSRERYAYITDFSWYITILLDLALLKDAAQSCLVREQLLDVVVRVPSIRSFAVDNTLKCMEEIRDRPSEEFTDFQSMSDFCYAAGWICCEYVEHISLKKVDEAEGQRGAQENETQKYERVLNAMFYEQTHELSDEAQSVFLYGSLKLLGKLIVMEHSRLSFDKLSSFAARIVQCILPYLASQSYEVKERSMLCLSFIRAMEVFDVESLISSEVLKSDDLLSTYSTNSSHAPKKPDRSFLLERIEALSDVLCSQTFKPVAKAAQELVPIPDGFEIDEGLSIVSEPLCDQKMEGYKLKRGALSVNFSSSSSAMDNFEQSTPKEEVPFPKMIEPRNGKIKNNGIRSKQTIEDTPFYLKSSKTIVELEDAVLVDDDLTDTDIPIIKLSDGELPKIETNQLKSNLRSTEFLINKKAVGKDINEVLEDDAMPEGASELRNSVFARRKARKHKGLQEQEEITLADIDVNVNSEEEIGTIETSVQSTSTLMKESVIAEEDLLLLEPSKSGSASKQDRKAKKKKGGQSKMPKKHKKKKKRQVSLE